jgi:outer membrane protein TolC
VNRIAWTAISALAVIVVSSCSIDRIDRATESARTQKEIADRTASFRFAPGRVLTLEECEKIAVENNLPYRIRLMEAQLEDNEVKTSFAALLPQADLRFGKRYRTNDPAIKASGGVATFEDREIDSLRISTILPILDFGATWFAYEQAKDRRLATRLAAVRARQTLLRDVRTAYARLAGALRSVVLLETEVSAGAEALRTSQSLEREGLAAGAETSFVEAALARAELDLTLARRTIMILKTQLSRTMSVPSWTEYTINIEPRELPPLPESIEAVRELEQSALLRRPEVWIQDLERNIAAYEVRRKFAEFFPDLDGTVDFEWTSNSKVVNPSYFFLGFTVAQTLFDGLANIAMYRGAEQKERVEEERAVLVALGVLFEVDFRVLELVRAHDGFAARQKLVDANERLFAQAQARHREGLQSGADLARALADFHAAKRGFEDNRTEYMVAFYELEAAAATDAVGAPLDEAEMIPNPESAPSQNVPADGEK